MIPMKNDRDGWVHSGNDDAEPDQLVTAATNDQYFPRQYALQNTGQSFTNTAGTLVVAAGTADADVDAVEAWTVTTGAGIKVAVLDSGVASDNTDINPKVVARANFTNGETGDDNYGHGMHEGSMSSAIVAATAALAWSSHAGATNGSVRANVESTADKIAAPASPGRTAG
jgi:hypothetical protein